MSKNELIAFIDQNVYENSNNEITASSLNQVLKSIADFADKTEINNFKTNNISFENNQASIYADEEGLYVESRNNLDLDIISKNRLGLSSIRDLSLSSNNKINISGDGIVVNGNNGINIIGKLFDISSNDNIFMDATDTFTINGRTININAGSEDLYLKSDGQVLLNCSSDFDIVAGYLDVHPKTTFEDNVVFEKNVEFKGVVNLDNLSIDSLQNVEQISFVSNKSGINLNNNNITNGGQIILNNNDIKGVKNLILFTGAHGYIDVNGGDIKNCSNLTVASGTFTTLNVASGGILNASKIVTDYIGSLSFSGDQIGYGNQPARLKAGVIEMSSNGPGYNTKTINMNGGSIINASSIDTTSLAINEGMTIANNAITGTSGSLYFPNSRFDTLSVGLASGHVDFNQYGIKISKTSGSEYTTQIDYDKITVGSVEMKASGGFVAGTNSLNSDGLTIATNKITGINGQLFCSSNLKIGNNYIYAGSGIKVASLVSTGSINANYIVVSGSISANLIDTSNIVATGSISAANINTTGTLSANHINAPSMRIGTGSIADISVTTSGVAIKDKVVINEAGFSVGSNFKVDNDGMITLSKMKIGSRIISGKELDDVIDSWIPKSGIS